MDELKIKLSTIFMKGIVANLLAKAIYKKYGCKMDIYIDEIDAEIKDGDVCIHLNVDGKIPNPEFKKLVKTLGGLD